MGDVARPMLAEVLAALTGTEADTWSFDRRSVVRVGADGAQWTPVGVGWASDTAPWITTDPAEAQELLSERGLLPEGWCGNVRRGWWCPVCSGRGAVTYQTDSGLEDDGCGVCAVDDPDATGGVRLTGYTPHAATIPDLVAVASLGWTAIDCAEELLREACRALREYGCPQPERVVWRVGYPHHAKWVWVDLCPWEKNAETPTWIGVDGVLHDTRWYLGAPKSKLTIGPASSLWLSGLALDAITADAVRIVVPPVGGSRG